MSKSKKTIKCGTINPNMLKIAGKPNRAMTPEVKLAPVWVDRKNDYRRHKEKQRIRRYSDEYGMRRIFVFPWLTQFIKTDTLRLSFYFNATRVWKT